jgi:hypothetical protein
MRKGPNGDPNQFRNVVPICLGGGGSLFCALKTFLPRRSQTKAGAFSLQPLDFFPLQSLVYAA